MGLWVRDLKQKGRGDEGLQQGWKAAAHHLRYVGCFMVLDVDSAWPSGGEQLTTDLELSAAV